MKTVQILVVLGSSLLLINLVSDGVLEQKYRFLLIGLGLGLNFSAWLMKQSIVTQDSRKLEKKKQKIVKEIFATKK